MNNDNILDLLNYIDPALLNYQEWVNVGMALKHEGYSVSVWDNWSRTDSKRYHSGECEKKWESFNGSGNPVTGGTIYQMACDFGYKPPVGAVDEAMGWDDEISRDPLKVIDGVEVQKVKIPDKWHPKAQIIKYLETLFQADENVGYVTESWQNSDGKYLPSKGSYDRTAGELIQELSKLDNDDIGAVFGDYNPDVGAWIRFNPLDGKGVKNDNVTDFRYALVESDSTNIEMQNAIIRELELPVAALVYSGGKSIHAIVRVDAANADEYRKRVEYLYSVCKKNGLAIDNANKNPSRLSRMPGIMRKGKKQYLLDTNIGKSDWNEWKDWIESINDDLPKPENLAAEWDNLPELAPPLIDGVLRQGHKMLLGGPSKAGKSFGLIELCIAIAEGETWFGFDCAQGKIMYVNLELDRASCLHRFKDVYKALGIKANNIANIDIWNLRGRSIPMDKLAPKLIRRASKKDYIAIIIDPIYKVITGDENSADQMANFCNQFDKVCNELGCAVIYCHHHSKGSQIGKRSMDRVSGSGVFARDPDALLDMTELEISDDLIKQQENEIACKVAKKWLERFNECDISQDDLLSSKVMIETAHSKLPANTYKLMMSEIDDSKKSLGSRTAWRIEGTLREFPKFPPVNLWFDYPVHKVDTSGVLEDCEIDGATFNSKGSPYKQNFSKKKSKSDLKNDRKSSLENAYSCGEQDEKGEVNISDICEYTGKSDDTVRRWIKEFSDEYYFSNGKIGKKSVTAKSN